MSDTSQLKLVSIIIPAKDEAGTIGSLIVAIREALADWPYEIIVADDASKDETKEIASINQAIVVSHQDNLGKGATMKTGVENAKGDVIVFLDADGAHDARDIPKVIAPVLEEEADMGIGSRALIDSQVPTAPRRRRLSNSLASFVISIVISFLLPLATSFRCPMRWTRVTDCTSGFRAIDREAWGKLTLVSQGFQIEAEMIYEAVRRGLVIAEVPISCNWNSQNSHLSICRDGSQTLKLLAQKLLGDFRRV